MTSDFISQKKKKVAGATQGLYAASPKLHLLQL